MIRDTVPESNPDTATQNVLRIYFPNIDFANMPRHMNYRELPECMERLYKGVTEPRKRRPSTDDKQPPTKRPRADNGQTGERCRVYTGTRPLASSESSSSASSNQRGGSDGLEWLDHWMIAFVYDDEVLLCDATKVQGNLEGKCERLTIEEFNKRCFNNKQYHGKFEIPKRRVEQEVDNMKKRGSYDPLLNNCQNWFIELLTKLKVRNTAPYETARTAVLGGILRAGLTVAEFGPFEGTLRLLSRRTPPFTGLPH